MINFAKTGASLCLLAFFWAGCATPLTGSDRTHAERATSDLLCFGTGMPGGKVTASDWQIFLRTEVTPRFPKGITWWQATGQWQMRAGRLEREDSYLLLLIHSSSAQNESAIREIISQYKSRFRQEAVLRVKQAVAFSL